LFCPSLGHEELEEIADSFSKSWVGLGPKVNQFEARWKERLNCEFVMAVNSATAALHLALSSFNFPKGKKVLVPSLTFASTATAVLYNDLIPVFVDSNPISLSIDFDDLISKYDHDCVAVIPVHYAGHPAPLESIISWAIDHNLRVIEDCSHTPGSLYKGKPLGTWGDYGCFSFEEKKIMTTGDGGLICSQQLPKNPQTLRARRWVGIDKDTWKSSQEYVNTHSQSMHWFYEIRELGYKYNMNDLSASIGLAQLKKLDSFNITRKTLIDTYMMRLEDSKIISPMLPFDTQQYDYQMFGIRTVYRDELMGYLKQNEIATGCHYTPLTLQPLFKEFTGSCSFIEKEHNKMMTLPLHVNLTVEEVNFVCDKILEFESSCI